MKRFRAASVVSIIVLAVFPGAGVIKPHGVGLIPFDGSV